MAAVSARVASALGVLLISLAGVSGCATPGRPPVADRSPVLGGRPEHYVVRPGDTLYSIAWRYELDFAGLARANGLHAPFTIYPGQRIRLGVQILGPAAARTPATPPARPQPLRWRWPVSAPAFRDFGGSSKGLDFHLNAGDQVRAAAGGEVVYAGNGLGGFRHLVIIKHTDRFLSAYSLNSPSEVREGQRIKAGAPLADIPRRGRDALTLHFEIRKDGEAVDPRALIEQ